MPSDTLFIMIVDFHWENEIDLLNRVKDLLNATPVHS